MPPAVRSLRQEQRELSARLRAEHKTWGEIAAVFCDRYGVNVRAAMRMVRDWSQRDAAEEWNKRWPAEPKTFKNFSYWELWPGPTGHAPSLDVLARLAELYECSVADLVTDCANFRSRDRSCREHGVLTRVSRLVELVPRQADARWDSLVIDDLVSKLESTEVHEVARLASMWSEKVGRTTGRRLLLKLGAGLSLAAAAPRPVDFDVPDPEPAPVQSGMGFSGIWHSRYVYPSTGRAGEFFGEHYVVIQDHGTKLIGQGLPHSTGSQLRIELTVDGSVATGTWREITSPAGYYKGATYHGSLQLIFDPSKQHMQGMWVGFGRDFTVNCGSWELRLEESSTSKSTQRAYHNKV